MENQGEIILYQPDNEVKLVSEQFGKRQAVFSYAILQRVEHFVPSGHALEFVTMGTWYLSARAKATEAEKDAGSDAPR